MKIVVKLRPNGANIARFNSINSEIIRWMLTKFVYDVAGILPFNHLKADLQSAILCQTPKRRVKVVAGDVCEQPPNLTGCHSNVLWATAKLISG